MHMVYQSGIDRFKKFIDMNKAIKQPLYPDYKSIVREMLDSVWAKRQSPARAKRLATRMEKLEKYHD